MITTNNTLFLFIEGADGVGKTTLINQIREEIDKARIEKEGDWRIKKTPLTKFHRPNSIYGSMINHLQYNKGGGLKASEVDCDLMSSIYTLDRLDYFKSNPPDLFVGHYPYVLFDRGYYSNYLYNSRHCNTEDEVAQWIDKNYIYEILNTGLSEQYYRTLYLVPYDDMSSTPSGRNASSYDKNQEIQDRVRYMHNYLGDPATFARVRKALLFGDHISAYKYNVDTLGVFVYQENSPIFNSLEECVRYNALRVLLLYNNYPFTDEQLDFYKSIDLKMIAKLDKKEGN